MQCKNNKHTRDGDRRCTSPSMYGASSSFCKTPPPAERRRPRHPGTGSPRPTKTNTIFGKSRGNAAGHARQYAPRGYRSVRIADQVEAHRHPAELCISHQLWAGFLAMAPARMKRALVPSEKQHVARACNRGGLSVATSGYGKAAVVTCGRLGCGLVSRCRSRPR